jgi:hypothetical protein
VARVLRGCDAEAVGRRGSRRRERLHVSRKRTLYTRTRRSLRGRSRKLTWSTWSSLSVPGAHCLRVRSRAICAMARAKSRLACPPRPPHPRRRDDTTPSSDCATRKARRRTLPYSRRARTGPRLSSLMNISILMCATGGTAHPPGRAFSRHESYDCRYQAQPVQ